MIHKVYFQFWIFIRDLVAIFVPVETIVKKQPIMVGPVKLCLEKIL